MTDNASAAGWVVQVTTTGTTSEGSQWRGPVMETPSFKFFNVAIDSADKAIEAARKKAGASSDTPMSVVRPLSAAEIASIHLRAGEAKPA